MSIEYSENGRSIIFGQNCLNYKCSQANIDTTLSGSLPEQHTRIN